MKSLAYTLPVLKTGKPVTSAPKVSNKKTEQAKQTWFIEYFFLNPETGLKQRIRETKNFNRIKDPVQKEEMFLNYKDQLTELLKSGWSPFSENKELKNEMITLNLKQANDEFLQYHISKKSRPATLKTFRIKMITMMNYFGEDKKVTEISITSFTNMMLHLEKKNNWSAKTFVNHRLDYYNFFNFLKNTGRIQVNPLVDFKEKRKVLKSISHQIFSDEDFDNIKEWLAEHDPYTLFTIKAIYYLCIRPRELNLLENKYININDPDDAKMTIGADISKNKKPETIAIDPDFVVELKKLDLSKKYLVGNTDTITSDIEQTENKVYHRFRRCLKALKIDDKNYTLYSAKHLSNVRKRRAGWSLEMIMEANRHQSLAQTEIYLRDLMKEAKTFKKIPTM